MAALIEAIEIKRKMFFEYEGVPYHCIDVEVSKPTARGGQTLVRLKMRNLITRAVFDRTFKAGDKFKEPDLVVESASFLYRDGDGYHFMDQETFETLTLGGDVIGDDGQLLSDNLIVQIQKFNGRPIGVQLPPIVELTVTSAHQDGPTRVIDGYWASGLDEAYKEYKDQITEAKYDVLFNEKEDHDAEISYKGDGRTGQIALRDDCSEGDTTRVHITSRPE